MITCLPCGCFVVPARPRHSTSYRISSFLCLVSVELGIAHATQAQGCSTTTKSEVLREWLISLLPEDATVQKTFFRRWRCNKAAERRCAAANQIEAGCGKGDDFEYDNYGSCRTLQTAVAQQSLSTRGSSHWKHARCGRWSCASVDCALCSWLRKDLFSSLRSQ
jgi:hypothetical protein